MISLVPLIRRALPRPLHTASVLAAVASIPHLPIVHGAIEAVGGSGGGGSSDNVWIAVVASITAMASPFAAAAAKRLFGRPPKDPEPERPKEVEHVTVTAQEYLELRAKAAELERLKNGRRPR